MKIFFLQFLLITSAIFAQENQSESTTGLASFLKRGFSARWVGMGGAPVALVQDASSIYWNPAGLINEKNFQMNLSYAEDWVFSDLAFNQAAISYSFKKLGLGIGYLDASVDGIELYDDKANYEGSAQYSESIILGGIALSLGDLKLGFSHINYRVNNLGYSQSTTLNPKKDFIILGLQYYIFKGLNVGVSVRNKAELLPNEYLESERKIGISYTHNRANSDVNLFNAGLDFNKLEYGGLLSSGLEFFPLKELAFRMGISNVKIMGLSEDKMLDYRQKLSFGMGYTFKERIRLSLSITQHLYPSLNQSWKDPFSRNILIGLSFD
ncbi:MAG: hypothetical protein HOK94_07715 [Candidatus Marinimicrobia bacterium]|jgi:hypothetical protein|nr:hypothetical protein [Bacteroidota bacterium]MBT3937028.1 hypothetical protein [Candidatus Neomarinimicrobiota bacterium]MBT4684452.1 hypothetical protein [Candidatus Neomarinimicrobiota bacterium]MBT5461518.1 hypothetical protein [Candidatus Neomarinimicrobiota bacterium]MBT6936731.1 hypothetical protein [Candidatus Neomarinimicrobiota bacterium]